MAREQNPAYTLSLQAGMEVKMESEVRKSDAKGSFFLEGPGILGGVERELTNGFLVEFSSVGELSTSGEEDLSVIYKHLKSRENRIYFYASDGDIQVINIITIPIHDHSSIVQGGPAFGTYYADIEEEET